MRRARRAVVFVATAFIASVGAIAPAGAGKFGDVVAATRAARVQDLARRATSTCSTPIPVTRVTQSFRVVNTERPPGHGR